MKNKRSKIIKFLLVCVVAIGLFFLVKNTNLLKLVGSIYNITDISSNIDNIQIGDKINYSANGVDDWEVLSINKGNNTIEIVSTDSVENLTLTGYAGWVSTKDKMQEIANKYVTGPYAIGARNLTSVDLKSATNITKKGAFWIADQTVNRAKENDVITNYTNFSFGEGRWRGASDTLVSNMSSCGIHVIVNLNDSNARNYNIGDTYSYSSNGMNDWKVLYVNSDNSISIVTANKRYLDFATDDKIADGTNFFNKVLLDYYDNDSVSSVRLANYDDRYALGNAGIFVSNMLTGVVTNSNYDSSTRTYGDKEYTESYTYYDYQYVYYDSYYGNYRTSTTSGSIYSVERGVRPVITLRYSNELIMNGGSLNSSIKVGDKVFYEANAYTDWKVLSIDTVNGTAEIVSSDIVKLLTLMGIENYNDVENIFQKEVDDYLNGDNAISARMLNSSDIENLTLIKDKVKKEYWLNNKKVYDYRDEYGELYNDTIYAVAIATYNDSSLNIVRQWATLESKYNGSDTVLSLKYPGSYDYIAGIRPVIKVKLDTLTKSNGNNISNKEIEVPKNNQKAVADSSTNVNSSDNQTGASGGSEGQETKENQCIVYDVKNRVDETDGSVDEREKKSSVQYVPIIAFSAICGGIISGLAVYYVVKKKK